MKGEDEKGFIEEMERDGEMMRFEGEV